VKCPKCHYLGFETGDRCKNCGYDFSLLPDIEPQTGPDLDIDLSFRDSDDTLPASVTWDDKFEALSAEQSADIASLAESPATMEIAELAPPPATEPHEPPARIARKLPARAPASLFDAEDEPLIRVPAAPRPPLAVRRTPEAPRLRAVPRPVPRPTRPIEAAPALDFVEETPAPPAVVAPITRTHRGPSTPAVPPQVEVSGAMARLTAAAIDHLLLAAIDAAVVYFTLRMTGLTLAELWSLPLVPLVAFLMLVKLSYFSAFTAVGGQTIGKMTTRIRVVTADDEMVDGRVAVKRTLAGMASTACFGLGLIPALFDVERRALHDRLTRTRVVALPSA
jgi:uncharacterized RDD family membrane protein YckC